MEGEESKWDQGRVKGQSCFSTSHLQGYHLYRLYCKGHHLDLCSVMQGAFMLPEIVISEMQFLLQILHDFKNITVVFDKKELKNLYH